MVNQIHEELEKWPTISNFLFCTLWYVYHNHTFLEHGLAHHEPVLLGGCWLQDIHAAVEHGLGGVGLLHRGRSGWLPQYQVCGKPGECLCVGLVD